MTAPRILKVEPYEGGEPGNQIGPGGRRRDGLLPQHPPGQAQLGTTYYTEDAIAVPPNHEPVRGRAAIIEYMRARDGFGDIEVGPPHNASASGNLVSLVANYEGQDGAIRATAHELFERQPDGSLKVTVDMFGFRDPGR